MKYRDKFALWVLVFSALLVSVGASAAQKFSPSDVFGDVEYANRLASRLLSDKDIQTLKLPMSFERSAKPMHVYELHISVLSELSIYALSNQLRPPPIATSTPINYEPTDVYYLTQLIVSKLEEIHIDKLGELTISVKQFSGKSPSNVYQEIFNLFYRLSVLNGKSKISPSTVFEHITRAQEDLQRTLVTLSKRLDDSKEEKKRLLLTSVYGTHPDASSLSTKPEGKTPGDVLKKALDVRAKLNILRTRYNLPSIQQPQIEAYNGIKPIDVFLQTQFIIAELNLLKQPLKISSATSRARTAKDKTPSDVYYVMQHMEYMIERLISVNIQ